MMRSFSLFLDTGKVRGKMLIEYKDTKEFSASQLQRLFLSVNWESGKYPEKLEKAMRNSTHVISA